MKRNIELEKVLESTVTGAGCYLWGVEIGFVAKKKTICVYADKIGGITIDEIGRLSNQISRLLDVEEHINGEYNLEVSSPGLDRPLYTLEHYSSRIGETISVHMSFPIDGRQNFKGELIEVSESNIKLLIDEQIYELTFADIDKARVVPDIKIGQKTGQKA